MSEIVLVSASRTVQQDVGISTVRGGVHGRAVAFIVDVTDLQLDTPVITPRIEFIDPASGKKFIMLQGAAISTVSSVVLRISPDLVAAANTIAQDIVPETLHLVVAVADAKPITYSVGMVHA